MDKVTVNKFSPGTPFTRKATLDGKLTVALAGMELSEEDFEIFHRWRIKDLYLIDEGEAGQESLDDMLQRFAKEKKIYFDTIDSAVKSLSRFFDEVSRRGNGSLKDIHDTAVEILSILKRNKNFMEICVVMKLSSQSTIEIDAFKTAIYSLVIGSHLKLSDEKLLELYECSILCYIGLFKMKQLMQKPEKLTPQERQVMQTHPIESFKIVKDKMKLPNLYCLVVLTHQENVDGSGYPRKLKADKIPLFSKIIAVAKEYVALSVEKPYRPNFSLYASMRTLIADGKKKFDQTVLSCLLANLSLYPVGSVAKLNDDRLGIVVSANPKIPLRPIVQVVLDENLEPLKRFDVINLAEEKSIFIKTCITDNAEIEKAYMNL